MVVDDHGLEVLKKAGEQVTPGDPSNYFIKVGNKDGTLIGSPTTTGGVTQHKTDALVATAVAVKASAGQVYGYHISNRSNAEAYVHFYDIAQGSVTVGTSTRLRTLHIPQDGVIDTALDFGLTFGTAITIAATTTITGSTAPSTGLLVMVDYV